MNGFLNVLKPPGMTSHDVVKFCRKYFNDKVGHGGTLDPGAAGVLPICLGKATKAVEFVIAEKKKYRAEINLGIVTNTGDREGKIIEERKFHNMSLRDIEYIFGRFVGDIWQVPPMYSAIKHKGERLYHLARRGEKVSRKARKVKIYNLRIVSYFSRWQQGCENWYIIFDVECSKGTYIRSLAAQLGESLGCGAHLSFLLRCKVGQFLLENASTLEEIIVYFNANQIDKIIIPTEKVLTNFSSIVINKQAALKISNGSYLDIQEITECGEHFPGERVKVYRRDGIFLAIAVWKKYDNCLRLKPEKVFV